MMLRAPKRTTVAGQAVIVSATQPASTLCSVSTTARNAAWRAIQLHRTRRKMVSAGSGNVPPLFEVLDIGHSSSAHPERLSDRSVCPSVGTDGYNVRSGQMGAMVAFTPATVLPAQLGSSGQVDRRQVPPSHATLYHAHKIRVNIITARDLCGRFRRGQDKQRLFLREFGHPVARPSRNPSARNRIARILERRSGLKVARVHAGRVVAPMTDNLPFGDIANKQPVGSAVRLPFFRPSKYPVATMACCRRPRPAFIRPATGKFTLKPL